MDTYNYIILISINLLPSDINSISLRLINIRKNLHSQDQHHIQEIVKFF